MQRYAKPLSGTGGSVATSGGLVSQWSSGEGRQRIARMSHSRRTWILPCQSIVAPTTLNLRQNAAGT